MIEDEPSRIIGDGTRINGNNVLFQKTQTILPKEKEQKQMGEKTINMVFTKNPFLFNDCFLDIWYFYRNRLYK